MANLSQETYLREQHHSNYKANQTPSSLPQVGHTRGANTFPLRNQSLALESLKDQLGFLVTIILDGDSFIHKNKQTRNQTKNRHRTPHGGRATPIKRQFLIRFGNKLWMRNFLLCIRHILGICFLYLLVRVLLVVVGCIRSRLILMGLLSDKSQVGCKRTLSKVWYGL